MQLLVLIPVAVLVVIVGVLIVVGFRLVPQANAMVIERLGRYHRTIGSGIHVVWPILEKEKTLHVRYVRATPGRAVARADSATLAELEVASTVEDEVRLIDLRERVLNFPKQSVITKDNVIMDIDAVLFYQIAEPQKAVYEVANLPYAIEMLTMTTLRSVVGEMDLDDTLSQRERINARLREVLEATGKWGTRVTRVEIQDIRPPEAIQTAMSKQMEAERERRAAVTKAEAAKQAAILEADGKRESDIRRAEGEAQARLEIVEAEAEAVAKLRTAMGSVGNPASYLIALKYLETLVEMSKGQATKMFLPFEATGVLGALAGVREMLAGDKTSDSGRAG